MKQAIVASRSLGSSKVIRWSPPWLIAMVVLLSAWGPARADLGSLVTSQTSGDLRVSVFASPSPVRTGAVEWSVFVVASADHHETITGPLRIRFAREATSPQSPHAHHAHGAEPSPKPPPAHHAQHSQHAEHTGAALPVEIPLDSVDGVYRGQTLINESGTVEATLFIEASGRAHTLTFPIEIGQADPWTAHWPALVFPWIALLVYTLHQWIVGREFSPGDPT